MKNKRDWMDRLLDYPISGTNATLAVSVVLFVVACLILFMQSI